MSTPATAAAPPKVPPKAQVKETLISLIIAFVMAFVFRAFVIEAFIIPTGSMAPTLDGAHITAVSPSTGYRWDVNPQQYMDAPRGTQPVPKGTQSLTLHDPMTREELVRTQPLLAGDRILVFKYLYTIYDPRRWDVVVFKAPHDPQTNYIKRLLGLPGEMPAIIDGDLFVRRPGAGETLSADQNPWVLPGWQIQRKPERVQRAVWQDVFWSQYEPLDQSVQDKVAGGRYRSPWAGDGSGWAIEGRRDYAFAGSGPARLTWDNSRRPLVDWYSYNSGRPGADQPERPASSDVTMMRTFPVSDLNMTVTVEPGAGASALTAAAVIDTRGHEFRAEISGAQVVLKTGALGPPDASGRPTAPVSLEAIGSGTLPRPLAPGTMTTLEFWHVDQSLQLWAEGRLIARADYDWSPDERLRFALGTTADSVFNEDKSSPYQAPGTTAVITRYKEPQVRWEFAGGPFTLHRVGLQRDLHYQSAYKYAGGQGPARQTSPVSTTLLGPDHFFVCGDNNPASLDARLWGDSDPWVREQIDPTPGIVPRDLMIGRAFFVYFPSLIRGQWGLPVPDFGHMRWIW
jgi:signal peptidase I